MVRDRRDPGLASLAEAVLADGRRRGEDLKTLRRTVWYQFLVFHKERIRTGLGAVHGELLFDKDAERRRGEDDDQ